ncbi:MULTISPECIES: glycoside hydrolase family 15 protein [Methylorubrum]|jgi:GH15 family glucan-1,4-alpha-glucosidase|uniref:glycoside hydrolase family 15 protein n=1 Tax=Methylorubrum TaxID=2282523 RepID=UPI0020A12627|nr:MULTISPECIES: glycoside hydrolase family 15 protein [Methylorubrum]MCP1550436.1 GH15 family glucan-1,4-alpha-glucosidase [Methylorubrum zatmanii]MCP1552951.1 GH15 family glucan-1,4-alpha-glucosidase [Methylorubrum extorquens]MCP1580739.1 GH15 family glucan-1,4-alpha-glucosidase [Methylorubrum extorquens]
MAGRIEDYALIGDGRTAALVGRDGSIDWLCMPRFDASALFASLLGTEEHGFWKLAPAAEGAQHSWRYRSGSLVLETTHKTHEGEVRVTDFMPVGDGSHVIRLVEGVRGRMAMRMDLAVRFDYGSAVPWVSRSELGDLRAISGPHKVVLRTNAPMRGSTHQTTVSEFTVYKGDAIRFVLSYGASHEDDPPPIEPRRWLDDTNRFWREWSSRCTAAQTPWDDILRRSLLTLKALIYRPTGGIVAAPTTSLPEELGGVRNWDYRFCWLRDSTFTLLALMDSGYIEEARAWRDWLTRAVAGNPEQAHILYGIGGERLLPEIELDWLPGYEGSKPVRVGNAAIAQFQLDVYGELFDALFQARARGMGQNKEGLRVGQAIITHLETAWHEPDEGIWEVRGGRRHFVHSKVMAWVAFDRAIRSVEMIGDDDLHIIDAPVAHWKAIRDEIHAEVCAKGFDPELNSFVQSYGSKALDASLLLIAHMGFLPQDDPRVVGTVAAVESHLMRDGFILRYETEGQTTDGLPGNEGAFLPCSFWYADNLIGLGRCDEARALIERLIGVCTDLGLVSEEYDVRAKRLVGNFPQAFTHVALVNTILNYSRATGPAKERGSGAEDSESRVGESIAAQ